jgi:hypothetical protein
MLAVITDTGINIPCMSMELSQLLEQAKPRGRPRVQPPAPTTRVLGCFADTSITGQNDAGSTGGTTSSFYLSDAALKP